MGMDTNYLITQKTMIKPLIFVNRFEQRGWKGLGEKQNHIR
jgi:hypothetical protein